MLVLSKWKIDKKEVAEILCLMRLLQALILDVEVELTYDITAAIERNCIQ